MADETIPEPSVTFSLGETPHPEPPEDDPVEGGPLPEPEPLPAATGDADTVTVSSQGINLAANGTTTGNLIFEMLPTSGNIGISTFSTTTAVPSMSYTITTTPETMTWARSATKPEPVQVTINPDNPGRFRAILVVEEERTVDSRIIAQGATTWRSPPLPLMLMTRTADGHEGAEIAGAIETITRDGNRIVGEGRFDTGQAGIEGARLVSAGMLTGVSIDAGDVEGEVIVEEEDGEGIPLRVLQRMTALTVLGASMVPFPAIGGTMIEYVAPDATLAAEPVEEVTAEAEAVTAAGPKAYPKALFANPQFDGLTPIHVRAQDDGTCRVLGHVAPFGQCHIAFKDVCTTAPHSATDYAYFLTGSLPLNEGGYQRVGTITLSSDHADHMLDPRQTAAHYENTALAAAFVNAGEDEYGVWVSGVLAPTLPESQATALSASSLSGDWRLIGGNLELVAVLAVNVPGFPVVGIRHDEQISLVAAGYGPMKRTKQQLHSTVERLAERVEGRTDLLETQLAEVREQLVRLAAQVSPLLKEHFAARIAPPTIAAEPVEIESNHSRFGTEGFWRIEPTEQSFTVIDPAGTEHVLATVGEGVTPS